MTPTRNPLHPSTLGLVGRARHTRVAAAVATALGVFSLPAFSAGTDIGANTTVGGELFADFSHIQLQNENAAGQRIDTAPTGNGFDIKRLYLIVDHKFSDVWAADLTTDAQFSTASTTTVTTPTGTATALTNQNTSGGATEVMIKRLYLEGAFNKLFVL